MRCVLAVTTYNRLAYLKQCLEGFLKSRNPRHDWTVIVADDGSRDGTVAYLERFPLDVLILNQRRGVAEQTNQMLDFLADQPFDYCFKCDDDLLFLASGWDDLYISAIRDSGLEHLAFDHPEFNVGEWCKPYRLPQPVRRGPLLARVRAEGVKGCFYTITPRVLDQVGYLDSLHFFHGCEHIDYYLRCGRAGLADHELAFDAIGSEAVLGYRFPWDSDQPSLSPEQYAANGNSPAEHLHKLAILNRPRRYWPYHPCQRRMV